MLFSCRKIFKYSLVTALFLAFVSIFSTDIIVSKPEYRIPEEFQPADQTFLYNTRNTAVLLRNLGGREIGRNFTKNVGKEVFARTVASALSFDMTGGASIANSVAEELLAAAYIIEVSKYTSNLLLQNIESLNELENNIDNAIIRADKKGLKMLIKRHKRLVGEIYLQSYQLITAVKYVLEKVSTETSFTNTVGSIGKTAFYKAAHKSLFGKSSRKKMKQKEATHSLIVKQALFIDELGKELSRLGKNMGVTNNRKLLNQTMANVKKSLVKSLRKTRHFDSSLERINESYVKTTEILGKEYLSIKGF